MQGLWGKAENNISGTLPPSITMVTPLGIVSYIYIYTYIHTYVCLYVACKGCANNYITTFFIVFPLCLINLVHYLHIYIMDALQL